MWRVHVIVTVSWLVLMMVLLFLPFVSSPNNHFHYVCNVFESLLFHTANIYMFVRFRRTFQQSFYSFSVHTAHTCEWIWNGMRMLYAQFQSYSSHMLCFFFSSFISRLFLFQWIHCHFLINYLLDKLILYMLDHHLRIIHSNFYLISCANKWITTITKTSLWFSCLGIMCIQAPYVTSEDEVRQFNYCLIPFRLEYVYCSEFHFFIPCFCFVHLIHMNQIWISTYSYEE